MKFAIKRVVSEIDFISEDQFFQDPLEFNPGL